MYPELGILADDLTGATDSGLQFAKCGRRTRVSLSWSGNAACDVLVFNADSRTLPQAKARQRVISAARKLRAAGARRFYKKIDSTGRGNLGVEIEAMIETLALPAALICPAFPQLDRTVRQGAIQIGGAPLDQSEFARDPLWPATTASIENILRQQTSLPIASLTHLEVRRGPAHLRDRLLELLDAGNRLIIADAESAPDLRCLIEAVRQSERAGRTILPVGSAGMAEWLVGSLARQARPMKELTLSRDPILAVTGTMNRTGLTQLSRLVDSGVSLIEVPAEQALSDPERAARDGASQIVGAFSIGGCVALALVDPGKGPPDLGQTASACGLTLIQATERLVGVLGATASQAMATVTPAALVLTGGDTARAVCAALDADGLDVYREAAPGVPICLLEAGPWDGLPVVTKAGGFGTPDTLTRVVKQLEEMRR